MRGACCVRRAVRRGVLAGRSRRVPLLAVALGVAMIGRIRVLGIAMRRSVWVPKVDGRMV